MKRKTCEKCNKQMRLETIEGRDYWICDDCELGFVIPKKNCEHNVDSIIFGVNNLAYCEDCGNLLAYNEDGYKLMINKPDFKNFDKKIKKIMKKSKLVRKSIDDCLKVDYRTYIEGLNIMVRCPECGEKCYDSGDEWFCNNCCLDFPKTDRWY